MVARLSTLLIATALPALPALAALAALAALVALTTPLSAQDQPPTRSALPEKSANTRIRTGDQGRMLALVREGEKLIKAGRTTPYAKLQDGLKQTGNTVKLAKPSTKVLSGPELFQKSRQSVLIISSLYYCNRCTKLHATVAGGVVIGQTGEVLTNDHVIRSRPDQKRETIVAMTADGTVIPVKEVLAGSRADDLAVLRLDTAGGKSLPALPLGNNPLPGSPIRVMSHPDKHFFHFSDGVVARYFAETGQQGRTEVMSITADFGRGSSGCPVLDLKGNIVGLVSRTSSLYYRQTKQKQENLQMVFKLTVAASRIAPLVRAKRPRLIGTTKPLTKPLTKPRPLGKPTDDTAAFRAIEKQLQVRRRGTLVFARPTEAGVDRLVEFLKAYPKSKHRQEALYVRGLSLWMLKRYSHAAAAYRTLLDAFPEGKHTRLARIREAGALLFSDQPQPALERLDELMADYPDQPERYGRERAHALVLLGRLKEARDFMDHVESQMLAAGKDRLVPRMQRQFAPLRMVGRPLKAFQVARHNAPGQIDTAQLKGQVVLIDFWATWCRPCLAELPYLQDAHRKFAKQGFQIVSISLDDKQQTLDEFISREKMDWLHHYDGKKWKNELAVLFDVHSIPMNLLVDRQGIVQAANLRGNAVARRVRELLKTPAAAPKK